MKYSVFDTLLDGTIVLNENEELVYCNEALSSLAGVPLKRIKMGSKLESYVSFAPNPYRVSDGLKSIGGPTPYKEVQFTSRYGRQGKVQVSIQPMASHWIFFFRDVTLEDTLHKKYRSQLDEKERALVRLQKAQEALKSYSKNLEKKVQERTADLAASNLMLGAMINSLGQGFIVFDENGICSPVHSRACLSLFETDPSHKNIQTVLRIPASGIENFKKWTNLLFQEALSFEDMALLGPKTFPHSKNRHITLEYHAVRDESKVITRVVVVATDKTDEMVAIRQTEKERAYAKTIITLTQNREMFWQFIRDARHVLQKIPLMLEDSSKFDAQNIFILAHTLKGVAGIFSVDALVQNIHDFETLFKEVIDSSTDLRPLKLTEMKTLLNKARGDIEDFLNEHKYILGGDMYADDKRIEVPFNDLLAFFARLEKQRDLAEIFEEDFIKEPIGKFFRQYDCLISEMAKRTEKALYPLVFKGDDLHILAQPYMEIFKAMAHVFKNMVEHGIEKPKERQERGKSPIGAISVEFSRSPGHVHILTKDDGRGIDPKAIRERLAANGSPVRAGETDSEVIQHIFDDGFTTKNSADIFSGRGIGMRAVQEAVHNLGGSVHVESKLGVGTSLVITLPDESQVQNAQELRVG